MSDKLIAEAALHNTQQTQQMNIHAFSEIQTRNPSSQVALDLCVRPHDHQDRHTLYLYEIIY
jgi:hypothetical protein